MPLQANCVMGICEGRKTFVTKGGFGKVGARSKLKIPNVGKRGQDDRRSRLNLESWQLLHSKS
jgi:hypothetical protein